MSATVKVLLRSDVDGVGRRGEIVEVAKGFARNFLEPRGLALKATTGAERQAEAMRRTRALRDARDREAAEELAKVLVTTVISVSGRAGEGGRLFGSVTAADISAALRSQAGVTIDRHAIHLDEHIKTVGTHQAQIRLHSDVQFPVTVEVSAA